MTQRALRGFSLDEEKLSVKDAEFRKHLQRRHCLWLPVSLPCDRPGSLSSPPADVALWLFELRHASDSSEILDSLRLNVECENVASEVWIVSGDEEDGDSMEERYIDSEVRSDCGSDISYRKEDMKASPVSSVHNLNLGTDDGNNFQLTKVTAESWEASQESKQCPEPRTQTQNPPDPKAVQWELNPVYSGEQLEEFQRNDRQEEEEEREGEEGQRRGMSATTATITRFRKLCNSALAELDNICNIGGSTLATPTTSFTLLPDGSEINASVITPVISDRQENDSPDNYPSCTAVSGNDQQSVSDCNTMDFVSCATLNCQMPPNDKHRCHLVGENSVAVLSHHSGAANVNNTFHIGILDIPQCEVCVSNDCVAPAKDYQGIKTVDASFKCTDVENNNNNQEMSYMDEKCEEVLKGLDDIIQSLGVDSEDSSTDYEMEPDKEFLDLCQKADDLAEESIENCPIKPKIFPKEVEEIKKTRTVTMSSDLSDDVFFSAPTAPEVLSPPANEVRRHNSLNINTIFDNGVTPPVPPARKKKGKKRRKTIEIDGTVSDKCTADVSLLSEPSVMQNKGDASQNEAQHFKMFHIGDEQSQELLLLKRATESTKERRHTKAASFYEDADACCCKSKLSEGSMQNQTCSLSCRLHTSFSSSKGSSAVHIPNTCKSAEAHTYGNDVVKYSHSAPESYSEDSCSVGSPLGITLTQTKPISFMEFPLKRPSVEVPTSDVMAVSSGDETFQSSTSEYWSANSVLESSQCEWLGRSRKGSTSSDIVAWKRQLQLSGYLDDEGDDDSLMVSNEWYSSNDSEGRVYFFEENSHESSWVLPEISITPGEIKPCPEVPAPSPPVSSKVPPSEGKKKSVKKKQEDNVMLRSSGHLELDGDNQYRMAKAHSMVLVDPRGEKQTSSKSSSFPRNWPELWDGNMCVLKEGTLNRTKITENGKKLRKNWAPAHVVLTELFLLFFKDAKSFVAMRNAHGDHSSEAMRPELSVDLNGALLERGNKVSSRRNVFLVSTVLGLQVLVQCDNAVLAEEWYQAIQKAIKDLPSGYSMRPVSKFPQLSPQHLGSTSPDETKKSLQIGRSRSLKVKSSAKDESQEDLANAGENPTKIKARLKKFFHRRPTKESLVKKGIYRDEPVFGCHLPDICGSEPPRIPLFVQRCVAAIESKEENMKTDGLYRASGNLSQVQKIRLQIDQNNLSILEQEEDVHVLTGALKLFFRELKKPLISFECFNKALQASTNPNKKEKIQQFREIVKALPGCNRETLDFLLKHLLRVTRYQEFNRMHIPNLAIVFGPTLMWPEAESLNMALDLMQQNLVIECFLQEYDSIFR